MDLIVKLFGIGVLMTVMDVLLAQAGRKDISYVMVIAGVVVALLMVVPQLAKILNTTTSLFGF